MNKIVKSISSTELSSMFAAVVSCVAMILSGTVYGAAMQPFPDGARVAFFGDSITSMGGALLRVAAQYRAAFPERDVRFFNVGISGGGFDAANLYFDEWLASRRPTHVVLAFGVNDSGSFRVNAEALDADAEAERIREAADAFRRRYVALVERIEALGAKVYVRAVTPYDETVRENASPVEKGKGDAFRLAAEQIRAVATERRLPIVDDCARMSALLSAGEKLFNPDRVHPNDYGQWRMAETFLAAQGMRIAPYCSREETAAVSGLSSWDNAASRLSIILSAEWLIVHDESLDLKGKMSKVRAWLDAHEADQTTSPYLIRIARAYLKDKPHKDALVAVADSALWAIGSPEVSWSIMHPTGIDVKYMERVAAKAAEYGGVDSFEVCGPCHSPDGGINGLSMLDPYPKAHARVDAASVEAARAKMNAIVSIAHGIGKPLYYWHREIFLQPGIIEDLPQMLDEDGEFDLLGSTYQDYLRFKIQETFKFVPGLDGIVLTLTEADYSVIHNSNPERYPPAKVVEAIVRIFAEEHAKRGKKFILRSFGSIPKDYEDIIAGAVAAANDPAPALRSLGAGGFEIETKVTQADFVPWLPKNPFLKRNPPLTLGAECDCVGEYLGAGFLPSVQVSRIHGYVADARAEGADRFTIRIDRVGNSIFDTAAEANLYAYMRFIKDPGATVEGVLAEYAAKHYGDAAEEMAKLEGTELEMVRNIYYVASNLTFHTFPMKPDFKYVKAGGIFSAYHENADLSNCRGSWSMLYWQKAPTHERILAEKAKGLEMAERGLSLVKSLRGRLPSAEYTRLVRAWDNAVKVARALQAYTRCVVAYFEDMKADRDVPAKLEAASSEAVKLIESMMRNPNAYDDDKFHPVTEDGSVDYAYFVGLRFFCKELLAEYKAERAARRTLQSRLDVLDFIVPGGIYDDGRVLRPMHGAHSEIAGGYPVRWVGNAVFPNGTITVEFKDVPGAKLEIALDPSGSQEYKYSESVEAGRRKVVISKKGASYPAIRSISLVSSK